MAAGGRLYNHGIAFGTCFREIGLTEQVHTFLRHEVEAFDFRAAHLAPLAQLAGLRLVRHDTRESFIDALGSADAVITWTFEAEWYHLADKLSGVYTPAAGFDWVMPDPRGQVRVTHGKFHGPMLAESLLGSILFLNRRMPLVLLNAARRQWDRDLQADARLLRNQCCVILGYGAIGAHCAKLLRAMGAEVLGIQRNHRSGEDPVGGATWVHADQLEQALGRADHLVCLLPGVAATDGYLNLARLAALKPGAYIYNFGRGNALVETDLVAALGKGYVGGAVLDVTRVEPLPPGSPLWSDSRVLVMPHTSCVYTEYRPLYVSELLGQLAQDSAAGKHQR